MQAISNNRQFSPTNRLNAGRSTAGDETEMRRRWGFRLPAKADSYAESAHPTGEAVFTVDQLSERFNVSTKTISRWRKKGLKGESVVISGRRRIGFRQSEVDRFVQLNKKRVRRSARFSKLTDDERRGIAHRAAELIEGGQNFSEAVNNVAKESGRHPATIRDTIRRSKICDKRLAPAMSRRPLDKEQITEILREYRQGSSPAELASHFGRSKSSIDAAIRTARANRIAELPLDYISNPIFKRDGAEKMILGPLPEGASRRRTAGPKELPAYLAALYEVPLLTREQEAHLFRKLNYLKFEASRLRDQLNPKRPQSRLMAKIEKLYDDAIETKNAIVRANLRLVVSIAKKYVGQNGNFYDLVSAGNVSLMKAADKFDYSLGNKFSTYASWAIKNNFAREYAMRVRQHDRFRTSQDELLTAAIETGTNPFAEEVRQSERERQVGKILDDLEPREREIIGRRFGLKRGTEPLTLKEVGSEMGVSKERIRQIEARALNKLRAVVQESNIDFPAA